MAEPQHTAPTWQWGSYVKLPQLGLLSGGLFTETGHNASCVTSFTAQFHSTSRKTHPGVAVITSHGLCVCPYSWMLFCAILSVIVAEQISVVSFDFFFFFSSIHKDNTALSLLSFHNSAHTGLMLIQLQHVLMDFLHRRKKKKKHLQLSGNSLPAWRFSQARYLHPAARTTNKPKK